ncbi:acyl-CoA dehydrogenase domain protein [Hyphomicrobium denitrificans ATCC 51888]|uniref:3-methylmercaptopropionyl-CoA dehydrogenase n=1 Tax=Hyphomicrobium denitrificans (strain ATCC 51888 / DSM 1869 / NCIMB 11706 / TK 0415) TaxID=582899 RepID=D8JPP9_HYPDA|nr:acyl-CoA dehydrogenase [Hyphomicrobium denitrificans]ADJ23783.1 acyl-CoA dehydrogenase domain protein [Hyphomicrobium denitrificans ATCC 51888]
MTYQAPVDDIVFALKTAAGLDDLLRRGLYAGLDAETIRAVIEEAGKFGAEVLAPLNAPGDKTGSKFSAGSVTTPPGFRDAYRQFAEGGWSSLPCAEEFGGQGLPEIVSAAVGEIWNASNVSFGLCPLLTQGAIHAIEAGGTDAIKAKYLPNMVAGKWTGTMNLTEPHAGSDLGPLTTRAVPQDDGTYRITGTKIFITYGEHDMAENIIHLVLARRPDAPAGTRGISLFLVPKFLVNDDGSLGERNDVVCAGVEHKLGIMASPTCVMKFGENGGATGYLIGEENRGLATMFVMMNAARLGVGLQGVGVAERATQHAIAYARERRQGKSLASNGSSGMSPIIEHADIRRMLLMMKALTQAARMICFATAREHDIARLSNDPSERKAALDKAALLTPLAKAFSTDIANEVASLGVQVHGGMGFVEETGAAQYLRDARILPIYEGTNGIQAIDLVTRKLPLANGGVVSAYLAELADVIAKVRASNRPEFGRMAQRLTEALSGVQTATLWMGLMLKSEPEAALASATPYLRLMSLTAGGTYLAKGALSEDASSPRVALARFFAENLLTEAAGLSETVQGGAQSVLVDAHGPLFA